MQKVIQRKLDYFFWFLLILISGSINSYYGFRGINPIDNFTIYSSGYYILNGYVPFKDFWVVTGPFLDLTQYLFFKILGVNWKAYVFHSSLLNIIFTLITFLTLSSFSIKKIYAFFYATLISIISYPQVGTPFVDHHASILSLIGLNFFILAIKTGENKYWFLIPISFFLSFMSKQTPTAYFILYLFPLIIFFFILNFNKKNFVFLIFGSLTSILLLILFLYSYGISYQNFIIQYFSFPSSVGSERLNAEFLFPIEFSRYVMRFKLIHLSYVVLLVILVKNTYENLKFLKTNDFLIIISLILSSYAMIIHQLLTLNVKFVYFIIPLLAGFSHVYSVQYLQKKNFFIPIMILTLIFSSYYYFKYVNDRKFVVSDNYYEKEKILKTKIIDNKYYFNWITNLNQDPKNEIRDVKKVINFFQNLDQDNYIIITDYQFIFSKIKSQNNIFINKWYHPGVSYPQENNEFFEIYKNFFVKKIKDNKVISIYFVKPSWFGNSNELFFKRLFSDCINEKNYLDGIIIGFNIKNCF
tara:strand:- start:751 stop:2328 length:1578 start_codon:yes stop_codon:yes gene_type:complete